MRLSFAEPIADPADLALAAERLAEDLVGRLAREGNGARRLVLAFHRVDGRVERIVLGTARPSRDPHHLATLLKERLDTVDPGLGVEDMILAAFAVEPLPPGQIGFPHPDPLPRAEEGRAGADEAASDVAPLLDRLGNRLGLAALYRLEPRESHIPERASVEVPVDAGLAPSPTLSRLRGREGWRPSSLALLRLQGREGWGPSGSREGPGQRECGPGHVDKSPRPIRLFEPPEPVEAAWLLPDDPPFRFTWRRRAHRVKRADGPERIAEEWWRPDSSGAVDAIRDYYRVEDDEGRRFWLFRAGLPDGGHPPRWYVHGVFA